MPSLRPLLSKLSGILLLALASTLPARGQTASDPQAVSLAARSLAALTNGAQVTDVTLAGTVSRTSGADVETGTITLKAMGTDRSRMDMSTGDGARSEGRNSVNGTSQGFWVGPDGASHARAPHNCFTDAVWFFPALSVLSQAANPNVVVNYVGQETRNGNPVQHLRFTAQFQGLDASSAALVKSLSREDIYLDSNSLLPVAITFDGHPDNNALINIPVEIDFSNYQRANGANVPFKIQELVNRTLILDITVQSANLNSGLPESTFTAQ